MIKLCNTNTRMGIFKFTSLSPLQLSLQRKAKIQFTFFCVIEIRIIIPYLLRSFL